jgi:lipid kinase YegS
VIESPVPEKPRSLCLILHGKAAADERVRSAVAQVRARGHQVEVRVTWEGGDAARFAWGATREGSEVVVAGGGDGTLHEVINGLFQESDEPSKAVAVVPLGTANDFARSCGVPLDPLQALLLAAEGPVISIDVIRADEHIIINVASGGFGAQVTATTPALLKQVIGGAAYAVTGIFSALGSEPSRVALRTPAGRVEELLVLGNIGNGRLAGGGFQIAPRALLDDGLLDLMYLRSFPMMDTDLVIQELQVPAREGNEYVHYQQLPWLELEGVEEELHFINLDGEPISSRPSIRFEVLHRRLPFVLPAAATPLLQQKPFASQAPPDPGASP